MQVTIAVLLLPTLQVPSSAPKFIRPALRPRTHGARLLADEPKDSGDDEPRQEDGVDRLNAMLDQSFFDPEQVTEDEPKLLTDYKRLFKENPELATSLYVGLVFALLLFFTQQGVRIYKHSYFMPDKLCPWDVSPSFADLMNC